VGTARARRAKPHADSRSELGLAQIGYVHCGAKPGGHPSPPPMGQNQPQPPSRRINGRRYGGTECETPRDETGGSNHHLQICALVSLAGNPTISLPRVAKAAPAYLSAKDRPGLPKPALGCAMSRCRYPTENRILKAAAKHGIDVRIKYGVDGRIASFETTGKGIESSGLPENGANPWDDVLEN
jgi:hypothetical protein